MTFEELKNKLISEAQASWNKLNVTKRVCGSEFSYYDGYIACGFIREEQIRALQKQNGELTDELKALQDSVKDYGAGCYENGLRKGKRKFSEQLTKAKEIISDLLSSCFGYNSKTVNYEVRAKAEQFLNEVEK